MSLEKIKTPCIGLCSTVYGDRVCRGCKRFDHEVIEWNGYGEDQKRSVLQRFECLLSQVMLDKCEIFDPDLLALRVQSGRINCSPLNSIQYCAYQVIRRGAGVIRNIEEFGIRILPAYSQLRLVELRDVIDREFFSLSEQRYGTGG